MADPPLSLNAWLRYDTVHRQLASVTGIESALEIGAGGGGFGVRLASRWQYTAVEPDEASRTLARSRLPEHAVVVETMDEIAGQTYDLVCAFEVLEHIEDDHGALVHWLERVRPNGWLLLSTPAHQHRYGPFDQMVGHHRRYDPADMTELLGRVGLTDVEVQTYGFPLGNALERVRDLMARHQAPAGDSFDQRTAASARVWQPSDRLALLTRTATAPFRWLQRLSAGTSWGTGLVAVGRRHDTA